MGYRAASTTKHYSFFYTMTALFFLVLTLVSMAIIRLIEARVNRGYK
jgi:hypothetical protein